MTVYGKGQPLKLNEPGFKEKFLAALSKGASYNICCGYAGINYQTFRKWMIKAENMADLHEEQIENHPDKVYLDFYNDVKRIESYAAITWLDKIDKASEIHWQAAAWKLERRYPDEYGRVTQDRPDENKEIAYIQKIKDEIAKLNGRANG